MKYRVLPGNASVIAPHNAIEADRIEIKDGALYLYRADGSHAAIFAAGHWHSVHEEVVAIYGAAPGVVGQLSGLSHYIAPKSDAA